MIDPAKFDDDWAELARELERDKPSVPPSPTSPTANSSSKDDEFLDSPTESTEEPTSDEFDDVGESGDDADEGGPGSESETEPNGDSGSGDGQPGTGRKRRRRRRRRRKGGVAQPAEVGTGEDSEPEKTEIGEGETEDTPFELVPAAGEAESGESEFGDEPGDEVVDDIAEVSAADMEEDAGGELLRELIANWNVPSWDDVVGGLYRPER
jgi:hypothetical protein